MQPYLDPIALDPAQPGVIVGQPATAEDALCWYTTEHATLLAAVRLAAETGLDTHTWQLAWSLTTFLLRRGLWHDQAMVWTAGLNAARRIGDTPGEAYALHGLAEGLLPVRAPPRRHSLFRQALTALRNDRRPPQSARRPFTTASPAWQSGSSAPPMRSATPCEPSDLYRAAAHRAGQAWVLNNIGYSHAQLGNYQQAITYCERALVATQELGGTLLGGSKLAQPRVHPPPAQQPPASGHVL